MNGRKPTKAEQAYINGATISVGCVVCNILGYENDAPPEYLAFHHNTDKGSIEPLCHFFGVPICGVHHQGHENAPKGEPIRHKNYAHFKNKVGSDIDLARFVWERLPLDTQDLIGQSQNIWSFDELIERDEQNRNH
ncbi:hypothetical protein LZS85_15725 [Aliivibrio fischeri]|uniref:hypothetical protein n=1 Tax=Aliivibrio fischeri TaxID=668 RepID=UPI001F2612F5|nr:hypothetical protein [Aliivibrio fischeri]MCE7567573.1 hypothetical protein [Aliivibrio fischeri]